MSKIRKLSSKGSPTSAEPPNGSSAGRVRVAAYCRYSEGPDQTDSSIEAQHNAVMRESAHEGNWDITWHDEPSQTAFLEEIADRPMFAAMLDEVRAGAYDLVVVHKLDRWARNMKVSVQAVEIVLASKTRFLSIFDKIDMESLSGWLQFSIMSIFAEYYSRNLSFEVRKGHAIRAARGLHKSRPPYGFRLNRDSGVAEPDTRSGADEVGEWDGLQFLYRQLLASATDIEAAEAVRADGRWHVTSPGKGKRTGDPRPFTSTLVSRIRHNVFYRPYKPGDTNGTIVWDGEEYPGQHVAACSWDDWHAMRDAAAGRRRGWRGSAAMVLRPEPYTAEFRGIAACAGCGHRLHVVRAINEQYGTNYERYICKGDILGITCVYGRHWAYVDEVRTLLLRWLEAQIDPMLRVPSWEQDIRDNALAQDDRETKEQWDEVRAARERQRWQRKRKNALDAFLESEITRAEWDWRRREADEALSRLASAARGAEQQIQRLIDAGRLIGDMPAYWGVANTRERQQAAQLLLEPLGLVIRPLGHRGRYHRYQTIGNRPPSCELIEVRPREQFRDLLKLLAESSGNAAG